MTPKVSLRKAGGIRFEYVVDSYVYALAMSDAPGNAEIYEAEKGRVMLVGDHLWRRINELAAKQGHTVAELGMTPDEDEFLNEYNAAVILEDEFGFVEVEWFKDHYDAAMQYIKEAKERYIMVSPDSCLLRQIKLTRTLTGFSYVI